MKNSPADSSRLIKLPGAVPSDSEPDTRTRLLDQALELFSRKGFAAVSIRDLARAAGVNVAAVNYYFSSKEKLWQETLGHSVQYVVALSGELRQFLAAAREAGTVSAADAALEQALRRFLEEMLQPRHLRESAMVYWEMLGDSRSLRMVANDFFLPCQLLLREMLQLSLPEASQDALQMWVWSLIGQCVSVKQCLPVTAVLLQWDTVSPARLASLIDQTVDFCLIAVRGARQGITAGPVAQSAK